MTDLFSDADIDFDRAASAFPDISLDGEGDISTFSPPPVGLPPPAGPFDLESFGSPTPAREVKVTGHDDHDIVKFESEFPELDVPQVRPFFLAKYALLAVLPDADDDIVGDCYSPCSAYIRCCSTFCTTSATISTFSDSNLEPTDRC
jgi:hypothetical protein